MQAQCQHNVVELGRSAPSWPAPAAPLKVRSQEGAAPEPRAHRVQQVIDSLRHALQEQRLQPGDRLPAERDLARELNVSRPTLRSAVGYLAAMGILRIRHGSGTYVTDGPPQIGKASLPMLGALHDFQPWQLFEARRVLEGSLAALAAERGCDRDFAALAEEMAEMFASCADPDAFFIHDLLFHRAIARASHNPILAALMETVVSGIYEMRLHSDEDGGNRKAAAEQHREIYRAVRSREAVRARELMEQHLQQAEAARNMQADTQFPLRRIGS